MGRSRQKHKEQGTFKSTMQPTLRSPDPQKYRPARDPNDTGPYKTAGVTIKERGIDVFAGKKGRNIRVAVDKSQK